MLRVRIAPLPDGLHEETLRPTAADLDVDPDVFSGIELDVRLDLAEHRVLVAYTVRATARLECDRTLATYDEPIDGTHAVLFSADAAADDDEVFPLAADAVEVDVTDPVRDTLLLALPLRRVCPEARDAEIPTAFGGPSDDEPADDRWAALEALRAGDGASDPDTD